MSFRSYLPANNGVSMPVSDEEYEAVLLVFLKCGTRIYRESGEQIIDCRQLDKQELKRHWREYFEEAKKIIMQGT